MMWMSGSLGGLTNGETEMLTIDAAQAEVVYAILKEIVVANEAVDAEASTRLAKSAMAVMVGLPVEFGQWSTGGK
jgi:hypothetical protein